MKSVKSPSTKTQLCRIGNYQMTGRVLGKGHFARVEEATHRLLGKTPHGPSYESFNDTEDIAVLREVAVKVLDSSYIQEEYARRHIHREPRVLSRLRHPCIAMLYETMICGPRLYLVLEACAGGDLCSLVLQQRDHARGLPETRALRLAAQLVFAVRHMHACGVVHRDLKMENIMLDSTKQLIKIVDFGLSNVLEPGCILRTPCGSLEYAAPELFAESRRYGPEVDMWSVGVIVFGMVTAGLPFSVPGKSAGCAGGDRPHFSQIIAKGIGRRHSLALAHVSAECREFIKMLLQPEPRTRLTAQRAAAEPWLGRANMHQLSQSTDLTLDSAANREIYRQIADLNGMRFSEVAAQIKADPYGPIGGVFNMKSHQLLLQASRHDFRPHSAQFPISAHSTQQKENQDSHIRNGSLSSSSRSLELKYPNKVNRNEKKTSTAQSDRNSRQLPSITESQVSHDRSKESKQPVAKSTVPRVSPRLAKEQIGKYQTANASASSKLETEESISEGQQRQHEKRPYGNQAGSDLPANTEGWPKPKEYPNLRRLRRKLV